MGSEIAAHLCAKGIAPTLWNRSERGHRTDPRFKGARFAVADAERGHFETVMMRTVGAVTPADMAIGMDVRLAHGFH